MPDEEGIEGNVERDVRVPAHVTVVEVEDDVRVLVRTMFGEVVVDVAPNLVSESVPGEPLLRVRARGVMFRTVRAVAGPSYRESQRHRFDAEVRFDREARPRDQAIDDVYALETPGADVVNGMVRCFNGHGRRYLDDDGRGNHACPECGKVYGAVEIAVDVTPPPAPTVEPHAFTPESGQSPYVCSICKGWHK